MSEKYEASTNDWVANKSRFFAAWGSPTVIMLVTWLMQLTPQLTGILWMSALSWMGIACLRNARQCGRMHCFFSGPYFLLSAVLALATGMQWIQILSFNELVSARGK
jgi:hypothetical protein